MFMYLSEGNYARKPVNMALCLAALSCLCGAAPNQRDDGYRGIWFTLGQMTHYGDKYSGGLGTYTANHVPMAIYSPEANKTFFVYGGAKQGRRHLLNMISYYDHRTGTLPRPVIVHDKQGVDDPHDNPSLAMDPEGHLWVFVSGRSRSRPGFIYRSLQPYDIAEFELVSEREITYPQPRWIGGQGFLHLFTKYTKGRELYWSTSPDGRDWAPDQKFAGMGGHYQTSHQRGKRVVTAFNMHPGGNVDLRTNLYYLETDDAGRTWRNARGEAVSVPLTEPDNAALVRDYRAEKRLVYIHDLDLDGDGRPVILYITSANFVPGPPGEPRWWTVARSTPQGWQFTEVAPANHNYSTGSLYLEEGVWRIVGPTGRGPQPVGSGGEVAVWASRDQGKTWRKERDVTSGSLRNHNYVRRPVNAHADFHAFWADGDPDRFSPSYLYFTNRAGSTVWRLPYDMAGESARPVAVKAGGQGDERTVSSRILVYTRNYVSEGKGYVHDNIQSSVGAIRKMGAEKGFGVDSSDEPAVFTLENLKRYRAVVFSNSNNEAFASDAQREAFRSYIRGGGAVVGIHSATGSERKWPYFWSVMGGKFLRHPKLQKFTVRVADRGHPSTRSLPATFEWEDECYYHDNFAPGLRVLLVTDPSKLDDPKLAEYPGDRYGAEMPLAWYKHFDGGRQFYTALGHKKEHYSDPILYQHILGGILWAMGIEK